MAASNNSAENILKNVTGSNQPTEPEREPERQNVAGRQVARPQRRGGRGKTLGHLIKMLFSFYPKMLPLVILCIVVSAVLSALPATFMQRTLEIVTAHWEGGDWESVRESALEKLEGAEELLNLIGKVKESVAALPKEATADTETEEKEKAPAIRFFSFETMDQVIGAARLLRSIYTGSNTLYKDEKAELYILVLTQSDMKTRDFNRICNMLSEYGSLERASSASLAFLEEHCETLLSGNAVQQLAEI